MLTPPIFSYNSSRMLGPALVDDNTWNLASCEICKPIMVAYTDSLLISAFDCTAIESSPFYTVFLSRWQSFMSR